MDRPYREAIEKLKTADLRPTRQRLALSRLLFAEGPRHVTAEALHDQAVEAGVRVSLATVYNTLHQFTRAGLLRQVVVDGSKTYFDTNTIDHHHFYHEVDGRLVDIPGEAVTVAGLPASPPGTEVVRVDVIVRLAGEGK
ncbi:MAG: transcriptional repressor [Alphaproteobacteria bacterium]|nr:transcriptional repressor [Alphaproteobacteria bacterium]